MPVERAGLRLNDIGVLRGYGVFDLLRTYNGRPFLLKEHLARLANSARALGLKVPISQAKIANLIRELLERNKAREAVIRTVLTGGVSANGLDCNRRAPTFYILIEPLRRWPESRRRNGIKLITCDYSRENAQTKTTNYLNAVRLRDQEKKSGAKEILYVYKNRILEASTSNFFIFHGRTLVTPKEDVLFGVTRNLVLRLARRYFKVEERLIKTSELKRASEAFITATNKEITPVVKVDNLKIADGRVGQNTKFLMNLFHEYVANY